jgi:hypothetical protein
VWFRPPAPGVMGGKASVAEDFYRKAAPMGHDPAYPTVRDLDAKP